MTEGGPKHARPIDCPDHKPVQHRDGKPPWCARCGCDVDGTQQRDAPSPLGADPQPSGDRLSAGQIGAVRRLTEA